MPAIIASDAFDLWLDSDKVDAKTAAALIAPAPEALLEAYEISTAVNRVANDAPALIEPVTVQAASEPPEAPASETKKPTANSRRKKDTGQASLF
jgi:hypothetical protein